MYGYFSYVKDLDKSMSLLMLVDFAVASLQMATLGLQMIVVKHLNFTHFITSVISSSIL